MREYIQLPSLEYCLHAFSRMIYPNLPIYINLTSPLNERKATSIGEKNRE